ncbi:MAG: NTP transferase domain-containing protein [Elainellaceae cyanobacterium]
MSVGVVVLAAGASTRLSRPKQLVQHRGQSLLQGTVDAAIASACGPVVVVLGAYAEQVQSEVPQGATVLHNPAWAIGMGTSICCGVRWLEANLPDVEAALLMVCDQPFVTTDLIHQLVTAYRLSGKAIAASTYRETVGVPALFDQSLFSALKDLTVQGAKAVLTQHRPQVYPVSFPEGAIDIDTAADVQRWLM